MQCHANFHCCGSVPGSERRLINRLGVRNNKYATGPTTSHASPHFVAEGSLLMSAHAKRLIGIRTTAAMPMVPPGTTNWRFSPGAKSRSRHRDNNVSIEVAARSHA